MTGGIGSDLDLRLVETHTAVLLFMGDRVHKVKKAVDLGFLDHRSREARLAACREEVRLNRRLAPDVYLGVADVVGTDGDLCDHMVVMRRMPEDRCLTRCVVEGEDVDDALRAIARAVATLHARGEVAPGDRDVASLDALRSMWRESFAQLRAAGVDTDDSRRVEELAEQYLAGRGALLARRIADGWVRDGHGDLMADDIYLLPDGPRILDCLEFSPRLRIADVVADVAFLAMDLERLGRPDLARRFLHLYREMSAGTWPASLAEHHVAYRAHIRAKVAAFKGAHVLAGGHATPEALLAIARRHLERGQVRLVLVGGLPGTGKSTIADAIADEIDAVVLRTDEVRQRIDAGTGPDRYDPANVLAVYEQAAREAEQLLGLGHHVVLDATWSDAGARSAARDLARRAAAELVELRCVAPAALAARRIEARGAVGASSSEATPAVAAALAARFVPWPEAIELDTDRALPVSVGESLGALGWPDPARAGATRG
ncbi:AAA family ATPase [Iamia sp. SCSIO 61187]|uniref:bifunctional aminoglycoside phosphotransferase/ATP-binding protein n=1 Tax=Iamia sp. SCSIO 61187 TaxID=2722752 RepID=UPI001C62F771|nr:AAA family ATPase [Iamia sp. SCSIO 61187]